MDVDAANRLTCWCVVLLLADWISRREDAVVYRTCLSNQAGSLALRLWDKSNNLAHFRSKHRLEGLREQVRYKMTKIIQHM